MYLSTVNNLVGGSMGRTEMDYINLGDVIKSEEHEGTSGKSERQGKMDFGMSQKSGTFQGIKGI